MTLGSRGEEGVAGTLASPDGLSAAGANLGPPGVVTIATHTRFGEECEAKQGMGMSVVGQGEGAPLTPSIDSAYLIMVPSRYLKQVDFCTLPDGLCLQTRHRGFSIIVHDLSSESYVHVTRMKFIVRETSLLVRHLFFAGNPSGPL